MEREDREGEESRRERRELYGTREDKREEKDGTKEERRGKEMRRIQYR